MSKKQNLQQLLDERIVLGDGAMGTMLYEEGVFLNSCFDEVNLKNPQLVRRVHDGYIRAGADFIETNTFGANCFKLGKFGLASQVEAINKAAVKIAGKSAGKKVLVAGAIGPLGHELEPFGNLTKHQADQAFTQQACALIEGGVDFIIIETFDSTQELLTAISAVRKISDIAVVAQMTVNEENETLYGKRIDKAIARISQEDVAAVGLNCSVGPAEMLSSLELIRDVTDKPISVQPNAGLPRRVENRSLYMCTPEYMAEYARRFFEKGARIIGGCCGTTAAHIKEIVRVVRGLARVTVPGARRVKVRSVQVPLEPPRTQPEIPIEQRSKLGKKLTTGEKIVTIEITPPRGVDLDATLDKAQQCAEAGADAINIPDGPRASSRLSPMVTAIKIQERTKIETVLHYCCRDRNLIGMQSDILGASAMGLHNILVITGDPPKLGKYPDATGVFDVDSIAFTSVVKNLKRGVDIGGNSFYPPVCLVSGVGANPVAGDLPREIKRFKRKVRAGAEFAVTQPVFDTDMLFSFLEAVKDYRIPVIAGIWPFTSFKNAEFMANEVPGVVVPQKLLDRMSTANTREHARAIGIEIAREMIQKIGDYVQGFAVSAPFGNVSIALAALGKQDISK